MSQEKRISAANGYMWLALDWLLFVLSVGGFIAAIIALAATDGEVSWGVPALIATVILFIVALCIANGFVALQPGEAKVCLLFGKYKGTIRDNGFFFVNPFYSRYLTDAGLTPEASSDLSLSSLSKSTKTGRSTKVSLRARTHNGELIKVNDRMGNPIEIATVVVWHIEDTAKALFDVEDYTTYVNTQTETALRHVASIYAYDHMEDDDEANTSITLRSNIEEVSESLKEELDRRLDVAGIKVDDARLTHLAYAPEIAPAMLRRQQAEAIIAARKKIVEGAVSMVDMALSELSDGGIVEFDEDRKATMASNLMVVLCGESEAQPVVNTGSLY